MGNVTVKKFVKKELRPWDIYGIGQDEEKSKFDSNFDSKTVTHSLDIEPVQKKLAKLDTEVDTNIDTELTIKPDTEVDTSVDTISTQTRHKPVTNASQMRHKQDTNPSQIKTQVSTQKSSEVDTYLDTKVDTNYIRTINGLSKDILLFILTQSNDAIDKITPPLSYAYISQITGIRPGSIRTTINRMVQKNVIIKVECKIGRNGWERYKINETFITQIISLKLDTNPTQKSTHNMRKFDTEVDTSVDTTFPYSSSNIKTTTTEPNPEINIPAILAKEGFAISHIKQILGKGKLTPEQIQDSLNYFAFDMEINKIKIESTPLNLIMGILSKNGTIYTKPRGYISPERKAFLEYQAEKDKEKNDSFEEWFSSQTIPELETIKNMPKNKDKNSPMVRGFARDYFLNHVWGKVR